MRRRLFALVIGAVVLVLLLFAIRGCLDARKERSFENYLRDLSALVTTSNQLSAEFFARLEDPGETSASDFTAQLGSSRGTGEDLLQRAEGLDPPGDLSEAQEDLVLAFELRRDGLSSIVEQIPTALGNEGRGEAFGQIALDMRQFLASDVLYERAKAGIEEVLAEEELPGEVPSSVFLTDTDRWLDELQLAGRALTGRRQHGGRRRRRSGHRAFVGRPAAREHPAHPGHAQHAQRDAHRARGRGPQRRHDQREGRPRLVRAARQHRADRGRGDDPADPGRADGIAFP